MLVHIYDGTSPQGVAKKKEFLTRAGRVRVRVRERERERERECVWERERIYSVFHEYGLILGDSYCMSPLLLFSY